MSQGEERARPHFNEAARRAALARRREIAAQPKPPTDALSLYVVRGAEHINDYGWEIRRYGSIVVARSALGFPAPSAARQAGEVALRSIGTG